MQKLNFPGTDWRGLALIGAQKKPLLNFAQPSLSRVPYQRVWALGSELLLLFKI